jgi:competence protein ComEC
VAISGLHIGFAAAMGYVVGLLTIRWMVCWWHPVAHLMPLQLGAWGVAWCAGALYSLLSGFALPTVRALLALSILCICRWRFRQLSLASVWLVSAALLLAVSPRWVFDVSFLLSFGAVGILIWCMTLKYPIRHKTADAFAETGFMACANGYFTKALAKGRQGWRLQWGLSLGMSPMNVAFFQQIAWLAPLINFIVIPVFSIVLVPLLALAALLCVLWPSLGGELLMASAWMAEQGLRWAYLLAENAHITGGWMVRSVLMGTALLVAFALWLWPRAWRTRALVILLLMLAYWHDGQAPIAAGGFRLTVLDVGQGLAVAVQTQGHLVVYDPGPAYGANHQVERTWQPFFRFFDRDRVDLMVMSHGDADHAGSAEPFLSQIPTERIMGLQVGEHFQHRGDAGLPPVLCRAGAAWRWDDVQFEVLFPQRGDALVKNTSCVLKITGRHHSVLLTGDIDRDMEATLLARYAPEKYQGAQQDSDHRLRADILLVPHHGSKTSSSTGLLHHVAPQMAVVSHGYRNAFGHPHQPIKSRYLIRGIQWLSTAEHGAITIESNPVARAPHHTEKGSDSPDRNLHVTRARDADKFWFF